MEDIKVEVISKEIIKPSSPTPNHISHYQFSFLDQINPLVYTSLVLFFEFNGERQPIINEISKHLKKSLAYVLTLYYPVGLARLKNHFVDYNDEGVPYLEAQVNNCQLSEVHNIPIPNELNKLARLNWMMSLVNFYWVSSSICLNVEASPLVYAFLIRL